MKANKSNQIFLSSDQNHALCTHCDSPIAHESLYLIEHKHKKLEFCCMGCMTVYKVIHQKGLSAYYDIKDESEILKSRSPVELTGEFFHYLDQPAFIQDFSYDIDQDRIGMDFFLEGIHCTACLWIVEKLPDLVPGVASARLNIAKSVLSLSLYRSANFSSVARELKDLGYTPHPLRHNNQIQKLKKNAEKSLLYKIGLAAFASGNIMIYSVSIYAGADGAFLELFKNMTSFFALPVIFYSAIPFYKSAWGAMLQKKINIDVPIALAIILASLHGLLNHFHIFSQNLGPNYFDTITDLIFYLLLSRYFLLKLQEKGLGAFDFTSFYRQNSVLRKINQSLDQVENNQKISEQIYEEVYPEYVQVGDIVKIKPGQLIFFDGEIVGGESYFNTSMISGESYPQFKKLNDKVFSGWVNQSNEIHIKVEKDIWKSKLGHIFKTVESGWESKSPITLITEKLASHFLLTMLALSILTLIYYVFLKNNPILGFDKFFALLIITCPCALALAAPLAYIHSLGNALKKGIVFKNEMSLAKLPKIKNLFFDKTGTLTKGEIKVTKFNLSPLIVKYEWQFIPYFIESCLYLLTSQSNHPKARALQQFFSPILLQNNIIYKNQIHRLIINDVKEIPGKGITADVRYVKSKEMQQVRIKIEHDRFFIDAIEIATFDFNDQVRSDSKYQLERLKAEQYHIQVLTGDLKTPSEIVATSLGLNSNELKYNLEPEDKLKIIQSTPDCMMIGDGANDAMAMGSANVGLAVSGAMDISLRASDIYLTKPGITLVPHVLTIARETEKIIYRNLGLSLLYNALCIYLIFTGTFGPKLSAIMMPLSSLSVIFSTLWGTAKLRSIWKEN